MGQEANTAGDVGQEATGGRGGMGQQLEIGCRVELADVASVV